MKGKIVSLLAFAGLLLVTIVVVVILKPKPNHWKVEFKNIASSSSPQAIDLNGDGIDDLVLGAGTIEFQWSDQAVLAIDGKTGQTLWQAGARNQVVGSPIFKDITLDGVADVFIGGRSAVLYCFDGSSGNLLWEFLPSHDSLDIYNDTTVLNFYNPRFIPDISGDGVDELLTAYGGFIKAKPYETDRPTGYLMILNTVTGKEIVRAAMPDRKETYMSPVVYDFDGDGVLEIIFGSGGETIDGHLYKVPLTSLLNGNIDDAIELVSGGGKGLIAPVVLADVTADGTPDIIVNSVNGRSMCFDGLTNQKIWEVSLGNGYEIFTSPGPGNFNGDATPDFFVSFGKGVWPKIESSVNVTIDGKNGHIIFQDTLGTFQYASPVVVDITQDGFDDVLFALNIPSKQELSMGSIPYLENRLMVFDIRNQTTFVFDKPKLGTNLGSTPLLTDLDHDGNLDVIYCYSNDASNSYSFTGMAVERMEIALSPKLVKWKSYMGGGDFISLYPIQAVE